MKEKKIKFVVKFCTDEDLTAAERCRIADARKNLKSEIVSMIGDIAQEKKKDDVIA